MSAHMAAEIEIGGTISPALARRLCKAIAREELCLDWDEGVFEPETPEDLLKVSRGTVLRLCDTRARWGQFEVLEEFLKRHHIPFDRWSEGDVEYDAELIAFRPGQAEPVRILTVACGDPAVRAESLQPVTAALNEALQAGTLPTMADAVRHAQTLLRSTLPPEPPPLEPFRVEGLEAPVAALVGDAPDAT